MLLRGSKLIAAKVIAEQAPSTADDVRLGAALRLPTRDIDAPAKGIINLAWAPLSSCCPH